MAENSKIEWTDHTFNPWIGCIKVSPGCDHCYAEKWDARGMQGGPLRWGPHAARTRTSAARARGPTFTSRCSRQPTSTTWCGRRGFGQRAWAEGFGGADSARVAALARGGEGWESAAAGSSRSRR